MDYHVTEAHYVAGYVVKLRFRDGTEGEIDLGPELIGPMFELLRDLEQFKRFRVDSEFHTLVWPNGADFAPEFLHDNVRVTA
ncbi:MAG TPA: DUF2442 domain-containing protein [Nitrospiraceae bacterium]|nr:DUF2442 domain-containing protein [Nitrospiraceae bacterium]